MKPARGPHIEAQQSIPAVASAAWAPDPRKQDVGKAHIL